MRAPWEYWEEVDESVCVVDLEQQTVVYLNRCARAQLLSSSTEPYVGKPCYTLLQGRSSPCPTCTGPCWKVGRYLPHTSHTMGWEKVREVEELQLQYQGRRYRVEWLPAQAGDAAQAERRAGRAVESVLTDCIVQACSIAEPEEALERLLCHLGEAAECTHTGIYELRYGQELLECYSWPKSFREQPIPFDSAGCPWKQLECCGETSFVITSEMLRQQAPELFRMLVPQPSDTMLLCPLYQKGTLCGFLRLDTVEKRTVTHTSEAWRIFSYFVASLLERRNLMDHFSYLGYHDQLTAALNRNALEEYRSSRLVQLPTGVIYCDINGLKQVNDQMGHAYGDRLIQRVYMVLQHSEGAKKVYRIGGDEFLIQPGPMSYETLCEYLENLMSHLRSLNICAESAIFCPTLSLGACRSIDFDNLEESIQQADQAMYLVKKDTKNGFAIFEQP